MIYEVKFPSASIEKKFERSLDDVFPAKLRLEIMQKIERLGIDPRPYGVPKLTPPLEVYRYLAHHRLRVGPYRILYDVDDRRRTVWILALRRRSEDTYK